MPTTTFFFIFGSLWELEAGVFVGNVPHKTPPCRYLPTVVICLPLVSAGRVCRPVTVGQEQPGSPTPLLHCGKVSGRCGRGLPHICL